MIIPVWKKMGSSTHKLAEDIGNKVFQKTKNIEDKKATHTGTLDPLAKGVVIVLTGDNRFEKSQFSNLKKIYEFEMLVGIDTDSNDLLGIQTETINKALILDEVNQKIKAVLPTFIGKILQEQPQFSAQRINGKSAFDLAKKREIIPARKNSILIDEIKILGLRNITIKELQKRIQKNIGLVSGNFRQKEILTNWVQTLRNLSSKNIETLPIIKFKVVASKHTYVRSLVRDISKKIKIPATTALIIRIKNGEYTKNDCKKY